MKLLQGFRDLKVIYKLSLLFVVLVIGLATLGATYFWISHKQALAQKHLLSVEEFSSVVDKAEIRLLEAEREEGKFLLTEKAQHLTRHEGLMVEVKSLLGKADKLVPTNTERQLLGEIQSAVAQYEDSFKQVAKSVQRLGKDEESGPQGVLRAAVHAAEDKIIKANELALEASMLRMRRHEKDFIAREDEKYIQKHADEYTRFQTLLGTAKLPAATKTAIANDMVAYQQAFTEFVQGSIAVKRAVAGYHAEIEKVDPMLTRLLQHKDQVVAQADAQSKAAFGQANIVMGSTMLATLLVMGWVISLIARAITRPVQHLQATIQKLNQGDLNARAKLDTRDEIGELARAFDNLLDDRVARLAQAERESERLNNSIIELIRAVAQIGNKDFTIKAPVNEDITGTIGDSLNLLVQETADVLTEVRRVSQDVALASGKVKQQSDAVIQVAEDERRQVEEAAKALEVSTQTMTRIVEEAQGANQTADAAIKNTQAALQSVSQTVDGINKIRDVIGETEKRIKRLGERSQEITGIVNLINSIAERTHILALNASMHAASAGEAGRGFAVVADEVQRLAENAREATSQISTQVNNIRIETADTVTTMNNLISQVAEGTRLAEQAGDNMRLTQRTTSELVSAVQQIAESSRRQAEMSLALRDRTSTIEQSTHKTARQLNEQTTHTNNLVKLSGNLVQAVSVFQLPEAQSASEPEDVKGVPLRAAAG